MDDLLAIRGVGQKRLEKMRKYVTVLLGISDRGLPHLVELTSNPCGPPRDIQ